MQSMIEEAPRDFRKAIDDFVQESEDELFPTPEACVEWARAHFDRLIAGELGGNLLNKFSMIGRFFVTHASLDFLEKVLVKALESQPGGVNQDELGAVMDYLRAVMLTSPFAKSLVDSPRWTTSYDVEAWVREDAGHPLSEYAMATRTFETRMDLKKKTMLETRLSTYGDHPSGVGKFWRTVFARDMRREIVAEA